MKNLLIVILMVCFFGYCAFYYKNSQKASSREDVLTPKPIESHKSGPKIIRDSIDFPIGPVGQCMKNAECD